MEKQNITLSTVNFYNLKDKSLRVKGFLRHTRGKYFFLNFYLCYYRMKTGKIIKNKKRYY